MSKFRTALGALAAGLALGGAAHADAFIQGAGPGTKDLADITARGFVPFVPAELKQWLLSQGVAVGEEVVSPDGSRMATIAVLGGQVPVVFVHSDCGQQGCLFIEMVSPVPVSTVGLRLSEKDVNAFNTESGFVFMTLEEEGEVAVRHTMPALVGCDRACQESEYLLYFTGLKMTHGYLKQLSQQQLVSLPTDGLATRGEAVFVAAAPGRPLIQQVSGGAGPQVIDWSNTISTAGSQRDAFAAGHAAAEALVTEAPSEGRAQPAFPDLFSLGE
jgi:hypothetical protein